MSQLARRSSKGSGRQSSRESTGPYHDTRTPAITDAGALVSSDNMEITPLVTLDQKPTDPESSPCDEPSSSSYVQNSLHQEQHNQYATLNIVNQGPNEETVRQLISQEAMEIGQKVYQTTTGEVIQEVESMKGHHARELENLRTNIGTEVTTYVQNQIGVQDQRCESRARSISKDSAEETKSIVESQAKLTNQQLQEIHQRTQTEIHDL